LERSDFLPAPSGFSSLSLDEELLLVELE